MHINVVRAIGGRRLMDAALIVEGEILVYAGTAPSGSGGSTDTSGQQAVNLVNQNLLQVRACTGVLNWAAASICACQRRGARAELSVQANSCLLTLCRTRPRSRTLLATTWC